MVIITQRGLSALEVQRLSYSSSSTSPPKPSAASPTTSAVCLHVCLHVCLNGALLYKIVCLCVRKIDHNVCVYVWTAGGNLNVGTWILLSDNLGAGTSSMKANRK